MGSCYKITSKAVLALSDCPALKIVGLSACCLVKGPAIVALANRCPQLVDVRLGGCGLRGEAEPQQSAAVMALATNCPNLTSIDLAGCSKVSEAAISALATNCRRLTILSFAGVLSLTEACVLEFANHCPSLVEIDFMW